LFGTELAEETRLQTHWKIVHTCEPVQKILVIAFLPQSISLSLSFLFFLWQLEVQGSALHYGISNEDYYTIEVDLHGQQTCYRNHQVFIQGKGWGALASLLKLGSFSVTSASQGSGIDLTKLICDQLHNAMLQLFHNVQEPFNPPKPKAPEDFDTCPVELHEWW
jgi:hypothetical protein